MKSLIFILAILCQLPTYARLLKEDSLSKKIAASFNRSFAEARIVSTESQRKFVKIIFLQSGQKMFAYYAHSGELMAVARMIRVNQLPIAAAMKLKKATENKILTELFEVTSNGESCYYATVRNDKRRTILKANAAGTWLIFKKSRL